MKLLSSPLKIVITAVEAIIFPWLIILPATGANLSFPPLYQQIQKYETTIDTNGDIADIYYPVIDSVAAEFPIALFLQGALLDKAEYTNYAENVSIVFQTKSTPEPSPILTILTIGLIGLKLGIKRNW